MINNSKTTIRVVDLLNNDETKNLLEKSLSTYPLYEPINDNNYYVMPTRSTLNTKLLNHYKYREIGFETIGRFLDELEISMNEIMPYYNELLKSADVVNGIDDIFGNVDITETFEQQREGTNKSTSDTETSSEANSESNTSSETSSTAKNVEADTPQGNISLDNTEIDSVTHASKINWNKTTGSDTATNTGKDTTTGETSNTTDGEFEDKTTHTLNRKGNQGVNTYAHDMLEFRKLIINIEQKIITDERISELFLRVY